MEVLHPKLGVNVVFDSGLVREGGEFKKLNRVSKLDYNKMIEDMPVR